MGSPIISGEADPILVQRGYTWFDFAASCPTCDQWHSEEMTATCAEGVPRGAPECAECYEAMPSINLQTRFLPVLTVAVEYRKCIRKVWQRVKFNHELKYMLQQTLDVSDNSSSAPGVEERFFSPVKKLSQLADNIRCVDSLTGCFYESEAPNGRSYANQQP